MIKKWKRQLAFAAAVMMLVMCTACNRTEEEPPVVEDPDTSAGDVLELPDFDTDENDEGDVPPVDDPVEDDPAEDDGPKDMVEDVDLVTKLRQDLAAAKAINSEVFGWMYVENTNINYPLLQADDNTKYLEKDLYQNYEAHGSIYADYRNTLDSSATYDKNTILYGHNKNDGTYFAQLAQIYRSAENAAKSPYLYIVTEDETLVFEVFAGFYTNGSRKGMAEFNYLSNNPSDEYFTKLLNGAMDKSWLDYGVEVDNTDKILSLSTCSYKYISSATGKALNTQRFVVMGRLLRPGEPMETTHNITTNPDRQDPVFDEAFYDSGY